MRYLNKIIFLNSAHVPYAEIKLDGNVHFIGTQGVGKSTLLRAILFFYNADKLRLGIPKEKKNFDTFYLPYANSYIVYEVMRENGAYVVLVTKSMGRAAFRFIDAPYAREWLVNEKNEVLADWSEIRKRIPQGVSVSGLKTEYYEFRDIIFGNNRNPSLTAFRKYAIVESTRYQNIPLTIQNVFLNSKLDADFIKNTIIQSMNEDELSIDLSYYRSQIETFEQEYKDVMLWVKPNKNGVVEVRKQADAVISHYRSLLYQKKQVEEARAELNYAERMSRELLPVLTEQIQEMGANVERLHRLLSEEQTKHAQERDKLVRVNATIDFKLKSVTEKRKFYEQQSIGEVLRRVGAESTLKKEGQGLKQAYDELTATYTDILRKYTLLSEHLESDFQLFENQKRGEIVELKEIFNGQKAALLEEFRKQETALRARLEDRQQGLQEGRFDLQREIAEVKQQKLQVGLSTHYQAELEECSSEIKKLEQRQGLLQLDIDRFKLSVEQLRQQYDGEIKKAEWEHQVETERVRRERDSVDAQLQRLDQMLEAWKGSFCEWLEQNYPGWQQTIGKVVDEQTVLYHQQLHPVLVEHPSTDLFGVRIDLSQVDRPLRTPEMLKEERQVLQKHREEYTSQLRGLDERLEAHTLQLKKKANQQIREISEQLHLAEYQWQQLPSKRKKWQADLETWQRKDAEWKQQQMAILEMEIGEKNKRLEGLQEELKNLLEDRGKQIRHLESERAKAEKKALSACDEAIRGVQDEIDAQRRELENQKAELRLSQTRELNGKGADTAVIESYQRKMQTVEQELAYIDQKRSLVIEYEKDKREYFDQEPLFRSQKKENELALTNLDEKYKLRSERYRQKVADAESEWKGKQQEQQTLLEDLEKLKHFRADAYLCPPEAIVVTEQTTRKTCGVIIDELKSMLISIQKETESFKKSVYAFNGYFTARNTFSFPTALTTENDFMDFASNLCEFVENNKIEEYQTRISERYTTIIHRISREVGSMTQNESEIHRTIKAINNDFVQRNFAGVIRSIELRPLPSNDKLMQLLLEIKAFNEENEFNMGTPDLFSQNTRTDVNGKAVRYLDAFSKMLQDEPLRRNLVLADTFNLQFRIVENDNDTGWIEKIANVGSDGTDILVKAMVNIMLINVFKEKASRKFGDFKLHCMMDEIGKLHPNNVKGILAFANCRNILLINSSPTTYNVEDYRYTYLLSKDSQSHTRVVPLLTNL